MIESVLYLVGIDLQWLTEEDLFSNSGEEEGNNDHADLYEHGSR